MCTLLFCNILKASPAVHFFDDPIIDKFTNR